MNAMNSGEGNAAEYLLNKVKDAAAERLDAGRPLDTAIALLHEKYRAPSYSNYYTLRFYQGEFWNWVGARWVPIDDVAVRKVIYDYLKSKDIAPTKARVSNVIDALQAAALTPAGVSAPFWFDAGAGDLDPKYILSCSNCLLDLNARKSYEHTPAFFNTTSTEVTYDANAPVPKRWLLLMEETHPNDCEAVQLEMEWMGYTLTEDTRQHKALLEVGPKRCGKGTKARVRRKLVGEDSVASPSLAQLGKDFGLQSAIGKRLIQINDARVGRGSNIQAGLENFLRLTGGDNLNIGRKYLPDWVGRPTIRIEIQSNLLPAVFDESGVFSSRLLYLWHPVSFYGREDTDLDAKLEAELPGILNWALDGLQSLRARGYFIQPQSGIDLLHDLERLDSPLKAFIDDCCILDAAVKFEKDDLYYVYQHWSEGEGHKFQLDKARFCQGILAATDYKVTATRPRVEGDRVQMFAGLKLTPEAYQRYLRCHDQIRGIVRSVTEGGGGRSGWSG
jgi:putative DNA primase/helicase